MKAVITVIGTDRKGIIAGVSGILCEADVNIDDLSQTILQGIFTMVMLVDLAGMNRPLEALQTALEACGARLGVEIRFQRAEVFTAMHQV